MIIQISFSKFIKKGGDNMEEKFIKVNCPHCSYALTFQETDENVVCPQCDSVFSAKELQRNVRFYVSKQGGTIEKVDKEKGIRTGLCAGNKVIVLNTLDDEPIQYRNIDYNYYYQECIKIIDPIKLGISPNAKGNRARGTKSGKALIKKYSEQYNSLFDDND